MPRLDLQSRRKIIILRRLGYSILEIKKRLEEENILVTRQSLYKLLWKYQAHQMYVDLLRRATTKKITPEILRTMELELTIE